MVEDLLRQYRCQYILADQGYLSNDLSINFKNFDDKMNSLEVTSNIDESQEKIKQVYESKMENKEKIKQIKEKNEISRNTQLMRVTAQNEQVENVTISFKDEHLFYAMMDEIEELVISYDKETYTIVISQEILNSIENLNLGSYGRKFCSSKNYRSN